MEQFVQVVLLAKSFLILMVLTTQLLAGGGDPLYLCLGNDGSYCCIHSGLASCTCCQQEERRDEHDDLCCCDAAEPCDGHDGQHAVPSLRRLEFADGEACGCTHVLLSAGQAPSVTRTSATTDADRLLHPIALPAISETVGEPIAQLWTFGHSVGPRAAPNLALTILSTVALRC